MAERLGLDEKTFTWISFIVISLLAFFFVKLLFRFLISRLKKFSERTETTVDDLFVKLMSETTGLFFIAAGLFVGGWFTELSDKSHNIINKAFIVISLIQGAIWSSSISSYFIDVYLKKQKRPEDGSQKMVKGFILFLSQVLIWTLAFLLVLDNLGVDITALITGLGVGGIAIALAVQNLLGDLFASLSIVLDKPFVIGDFIIVGDKLGTVEKIGLKTTRLRALSGEQLIFANSDLLQSRIQNFKRMNERRVVFGFGVLYQTPVAMVREIPEICKQIITSIENTRLDRAHFKGFGDSSLDYEVVYYVLNSDYTVYMDIQQKINLTLMEEFEKRKIDFAYPTRTLFIDKMEGKLSILSPEKEQANSVSK